MIVLSVKCKAGLYLYMYISGGGQPNDTCMYIVRGARNDVTTVVPIVQYYCN